MYTRCLQRIIGLHVKTGDGRACTSAMFPCVIELAICNSRGPGQGIGSGRDVSSRPRRPFRFAKTQTLSDDDLIMMSVCLASMVKFQELKSSFREEYIIKIRSTGDRYGQARVITWTCNVINDDVIQKYCAALYSTRMCMPSHILPLSIKRI